MYKVEGRDQGLVYQPRDSRRLSRVPRDEFIGFIIKRGSKYPASNSPGNLYISRSPRRDLEMREGVRSRDFRASLLPLILSSPSLCLSFSPPLSLPPAPISLFPSQPRVSQIFFDYPAARGNEQEIIKSLLIGHGKIHLTIEE